MCPCIARDVDKLQFFLQMSAIAKTMPRGQPICGDDLGNTVPNNYFGWGRIDALMAVKACRAHCKHGEELRRQQQ